MPEHLSTETIEQYSRRSMSEAELLAASDHLASCQVCRRQASEAIGAPNIFSAVRARLRAEAASPAYHLSYEQIAGFVDGELDSSERDVFESHLNDCTLCSDEVADLQKFAATITPPVTETATPRSGIRQTLKSLREAWGSWTPRFATVSAIALLLVFVTGTLILVWKLRSRVGQEISDNRGPIEITSVPSPVEETSPQTTPLANDNDAHKDDDANVDVALNDAGDRITMDKQGNIVGLDALSPSMKSLVSQALKTERVEPPRDVSELSGKTEILLGDQDQSPAQVLLHPVGIVLRSNRPRFRWRAVSGANLYTVNVLDSDFNILATSPALTSTTWSPSSNLPRGKVLSWQLTAVKDGEKVVMPAAPAPEVRFKVLEAEKERELTRAERIQPRSHLTLGVLYARAGLFDDAEREMRVLAAANPESTTARKLLRSIQTAKNQRANPKQ